MPRTLERVPESATERVPDLVMQQRVDRQSRTLQQPGLKVRRHPGLAGKDCLQPQGRRIPCDRLAEAKSLGMSGLDSLGDRDGDGRWRLGHLDLLRPAVGRRGIPGSWRHSELPRLRAELLAVPLGGRIRQPVGRWNLPLGGQAALRVRRGKSARWSRWEAMPLARPLHLRLALLDGWPRLHAVARQAVLLTSLHALTRQAMLVGLHTLARLVTLARLEALALCRLATQTVLRLRNLTRLAALARKRTLTLLRALTRLGARTGRASRLALLDVLGLLETLALLEVLVLLDVLAGLHALARVHALTRLHALARLDAGTGLHPALRPGRLARAAELPVCRRAC